MAATPPPSHLTKVLEESKRFGFLGPGPVAHHVEHASHFVAPLDDLAGLRHGSGSERFRIVDMGAGGGLPSLPMLVARDHWGAVLLDASQKRCSFLVWAVGELGLTGRVEVWCGRAEEIGHEARARGRFDGVVARGFGPPAATVECGAALLRSGGRLVISEPPVARAWPLVGLRAVGLQELVGPTKGHTVLAAGQDLWPGVVVFSRTGDLSDEFPRRSKAQQRLPLF